MRRLITAALTIAALASTTAARAGLVPVAVSITPDAGMYRYTYAIVLPTDAVLRPGDYFTIYNFDGFVPGSNMASGSPYSANWSFSTALIGPTPNGTLPQDDPGILNLSWKYSGPEINVDASVGLGNFWALSIYPDTTQSWFTASTGSVSGRTDSNITPTTVPVPTAPPPGVPEPGTLLLAGLGLPVAAMLRRLRLKSAKC
ncbi:MAG TPA: PEP-CTERM sorting domain-containing protein [Gemmata sp.]|nr:PEP-CTERM sorting domain-containing protein [Gemmata sp.]